MPVDLWMGSSGANYHALKSGLQSLDLLQEFFGA